MRASGTSQYLVAEADESDRSFLKLSPILAVVTNLDREHMDCYRDMADVERAFVDFMDRVPFYGAVTACIDNRAAQRDSAARAAARLHLRRGAEADFRLELLDSIAWNRPIAVAEQGSGFSRFQVHTAAGPLGPFELHVPGRHNVLNATAAVAIARQLEVPPEKIAEGLANFRGVDRRFQQRGTGARRDGGGRLRPPSHRDSRHAGRGARVRPRGESMLSSSRIGTRAPSISWRSLAGRLQTPTR